MNREKNTPKKILRNYFLKQDTNKADDMLLFQFTLQAKRKTENQTKPFKGILPPKGRHWRVDVETLEQWDKDGLIEWSSNR
jgi:hypothetical protein